MLVSVTGGSREVDCGPVDWAGQLAAIANRAIKAIQRAMVEFLRGSLVSF